MLGKGKGQPRTGHKGPEEEQRYSSSLSLTLVQYEGGWSTSRSGRFLQGKETQYLLHRRPGGPQGWSGQLLKISPPPGFNPRTIQAAAIRTANVNIIKSKCFQIITTHYRNMTSQPHPQIFSSSFSFTFDDALSIFYEVFNHNSQCNNISYSIWKITGQ